jgi:hypothetical protein
VSDNTASRGQSGRQKAVNARCLWPRGAGQTDASGAFRFTDNDSHLIQLQAIDGARNSPRITVRLWFRAQDRVLGEPLVVAPAG